MRIDALWRFYTIQLSHNLTAVHGERHSVVVLYREGKVQSCEGFVKEWFDRQHTSPTQVRFIEKASGKAFHHSLVKFLPIFLQSWILGSCCSEHLPHWLRHYTAHPNFLSCCTKSQSTCSVLVLATEQNHPRVKECKSTCALPMS